MRMEQRCMKVTVQLLLDWPVSQKPYQPGHFTISSCLAMSLRHTNSSTALF